MTPSALTTPRNSRTESSRTRDSALDITVSCYRGRELAARQLEWTSFAQSLVDLPGVYNPAWVIPLARGLHQTPYVLEARAAGRLVGVLPLLELRSLLFGRHLVSLPYQSPAGVLTNNSEAARVLISAACALADDLRVRYLELRQEVPFAHPQLTGERTNKVEVRLALPTTEEALWKSFDPKVRNQVRKGEKNLLNVVWGGSELLSTFYQVFAQNMRDLGTPVYSPRLFREFLAHFGHDAEFCVVRKDGQPLAAALLIHERGTTKVPSASSLRAFNSLNANMLMYWSLLQRAISRGQRVFDFGRSSQDSSTLAFKQQWGAVAQATTWQYYLRHGSPHELHVGNPKLQRRIELWRKLPLWLANWLGPQIVRGIP